MPRTLEEIMATLPEDRRARVEARGAELLAEVQGLKELRKIAGKTQKAVADKLHIKQPGVHQVEQQADLYLSTLTRYVEAVGGTVELRVTLPEAGPVILTGLGDLRSTRSSPAKRDRQPA